MKLAIVLNADEIAHAQYKYLNAGIILLLLRLITNSKR